MLYKCNCVCMCVCVCVCVNIFTLLKGVQAAPTYNVINNQNIPCMEDEQVKWFQGFPMISKLNSIWFVYQISMEAKLLKSHHPPSARVLPVIKGMSCEVIVRRPSRWSVFLQMKAGWESMRKYILENACILYCCHLLTSWMSGSSHILFFTFLKDSMPEFFFSL